MALTPVACASLTTASSFLLVGAGVDDDVAALASASCSTVARPILRPEPVTSATLPSSLPIASSPIFA